MTHSIDHALPRQFTSLSPYLGWALPTETERMLKRVDSTQEEIEEFRDAMMAVLDDVVNYLNGCWPDRMSLSDSLLYNLLLSLAEIAPAIEFYRQPNVIDGFDPRRFLPVESFVLRPPL